MRRILIVLGVLVSIASIASPAQGGPSVVRVKDFPEPIGSLTNVGGTLFFVAQHDQIWKSDGTSQGTVLVKEIVPGLGGRTYGLTAVNHQVFFAARDGEHGYELWKSDGTAAGTAMVKDIYPGAHRSLGDPSWENVPTSSFAKLDGAVIFTANDGVHGRELWRSDGTAAGTVMIKDVRPGSKPSYPSGFAPYRGLLLFTAGDGKHGFEPWRTDGTSSGTALIEDIFPGSGGSWPVGISTVGRRAFFSAGDPTHGIELWKTNATSTGTKLVVDLVHGIASSRPYDITDIGGTAFFGAFEGSNPDGTGQLWRSDGSSAGTEVVGRVRFHCCLVDLGGTAFFYGSNGTNGYELSWSDGTTAGLVKDINCSTIHSPCEPSGDSLLYLNGILNVSETLYFIAYDSTGFNPWMSDGTTDGTAMIGDIFPGTTTGDVLYLTPVGSTLYFSTLNDTQHGLWKISS